MKSSKSIRFVVVLLLTVLSTAAFGQSKKLWLFNADEYYAKKDYASALTYYLKVLDDSVVVTETMVLPYEVTISNQKLKNKEIFLDSTNSVPIKDYVQHQIGMCYHETWDYGHSVEQFKITSKGGYFPDDTYYYGIALMNNQRYEEAKEVFEKYIESDAISDELLDKSIKAIAGCNYAMDEANLNLEQTITMADTAIFNRGTANFAPMFWGRDDRLLFTSARDGGVIFDPEEQDSRFLCDLYWVERIDETSWAQPTNFGRPLNSAQHDGSGCVNNDIVFYTRWSSENRDEVGIYLARMRSMKFFEAYKMDSAVNVAGYQSKNPFVTPDGKTLYYSSNRPGGMGGFDLWKVEINDEGIAQSEPENLGDIINTSGDEVTPFFHKSTLFFSSTGHGSMGGLDVYKSYFDQDLLYYGFPINMGAPINSSYDDAYLVWDEALRTGFLSSDREPCDSGHCYDIYHVDNGPIEVFIEGIVFDNDTDEPIPGATVSFIEVHGATEPFKLTTDETGFYETQLQLGMEYFIKATKPKYFADAASTDTRFLTETTYLVQDFFLNRIPDDEIEIAGIEYDFDSHKLRPISKLRLDTLYEFLSLNDNLVVEINSHTDARGEAPYNKGLSERRAKSCVDYLISKGLPPERLIPKGYGEEQPAFLRDENGDVILDGDGNKITLTEEYIAKQPTRQKREEYHQRNRRTAFKVVGEGFTLESQ